MHSKILFTLLLLLSLISFNHAAWFSSKKEGVDDIDSSSSSKPLSSLSNLMSPSKIMPRSFSNIFSKSRPSSNQFDDVIDYFGHELYEMKSNVDRERQKLLHQFQILIELQDRDHSMLNDLSSSVNNLISRESRLNNLVKDLYDTNRHIEQLVSNAGVGDPSWFGSMKSSLTGGTGGNQLEPISKTLKDLVDINIGLVDEIHSLKGGRGSVISKYLPSMDDIKHQIPTSISELPSKIPKLSTLTDKLPSSLTKPTGMLRTMWHTVSSPMESVFHLMTSLFGSIFNLIYDVLSWGVDVMISLFEYALLFLGLAFSFVVPALLVYGGIRIGSWFLQKMGILSSKAGEQLNVGEMAHKASDVISHLPQTVTRGVHQIGERVEHMLPSSTTMESGVSTTTTTPTQSTQQQQREIQTKKLTPNIVRRVINTFVAAFQAAKNSMKDTSHQIVDTSSQVLHDVSNKSRATLQTLADTAEHAYENVASTLAPSTTSTSSLPSGQSMKESVDRTIDTTADSAHRAVETGRQAAHTATDYGKEKMHDMKENVNEMSSQQQQQQQRERDRGESGAFQTARQYADVAKQKKDQPLSSIPVGQQHPGQQVQHHPQGQMHGQKQGGQQQQQVPHSQQRHPQQEEHERVFTADTTKIMGLLPENDTHPPTELKRMISDPKDPHTLPIAHHQPVPLSRGQTKEEKSIPKTEFDIKSGTSGGRGGGDVDINESNNKQQQQAIPPGHENIAEKQAFGTTQQQQQAQQAQQPSSQQQQGIRFSQGVPPTTA